MKRFPISRLSLLQILEAVEPGLSPKDTVEQSSCFCFRKGRVYTFDGEILCKAKTGLPTSMAGAAHGKPLLETLRAFPHDDIEVGIEGEEFVLAAKNGRDFVGVRTDPKVSLPYDEVPQPESWQPLPTSFPDAAAMVTECAGKHDGKMIWACAHITPKFIECNDNFNFARWRLKMGIEEPMFVYAKPLKQIAKRGPTKIGVADNWLFFRNEAMVTMALQRFDPTENGGENLPRLSEIVKERGDPAKFPKRLATSSQLAEIFSKENAENNTIEVRLTPGKVRIDSEGVSGRSVHRGKVAYSGESVAFTIGPEMLKKLIEKHSEVEMGKGKILVAGGKWFFCVITKAIKEKKHA